MQLKDFNINDRILIYVTDCNMLYDYNELGPKTLEATLVAKKPTYVIAWRKDECLPISNGSAFIRTSKNYGDLYPGYVAWASVSAFRLACTLNSTLTSMAEGPCRQCLKKNSFQDKKCWWCQVSYPTDLNRKGP